MFCNSSEDSVVARQDTDSDTRASNTKRALHGNILALSLLELPTSPDLLLEDCRP